MPNEDDIEKQLRAIFGDGVEIRRIDGMAERYERYEREMAEPRTERFCQCGSCREAYQAAERQALLLAQSGHCASWLMQIGTAIVNMGKMGYIASLRSQGAPLPAAVEQCEAYYDGVSKEFARFAIGPEGEATDKQLQEARQRAKQG